MYDNAAYDIGIVEAAYDIGTGEDGFSVATATACMYDNAAYNIGSQARPDGQHGQWCQ